jgi:hypothetical protein
VAAARAVGPVTAASGAGYAASVVLVWLVETVTGLDVPEGVEDALGLLCTIAGGLLVPERGSHAAN